MRFQRCPNRVAVPKLYTRREVSPQLAADQAIDRGGFLARLWRLFGAPHPRVGGFEYSLRDTETGLEFVAYCGVQGPCYGGNLDDRRRLAPVLVALEELLARTLPANCAYPYTAKPEYGGGTWVAGCDGGRSFDMPDRRGRRTASQRTERRTSSNQ
jgi:hypothetical protein